MKTMEQACPVGSLVRASRFDKGVDEYVYEGVRMDGPEDKLIPLVDAILFHCKLARLRTRLLAVREAEGCGTLRWSRYAPAVFRNSRMLELVAGGEYIDHLTVQESRAA